MHNILVVEDSVDVQELLTIVLEPIARIRRAGTVKSALEEFEAGKFDLILMDVMLDDGDGFSLTSEIRKKPHGKNIPIIFLTSKSDIADKEHGFQLGAEDYIVKPSDPREIRLRVQSRLQKLESHKYSEYITKGNLHLDIPLHKAHLIKEDIDLGVTPLQFKILFYLMSHENEVISREQLISVIWGKNIHIGRSVDTHVNSIRRKLDGYSTYIQAVYGAGYVFKAL
ncbi:MAG: hypothetical protein A4S09_13000 [Proteobacteria bacterium SG_bin7]|nr:MAG: hypothetical protein A4S09_13000 [Proteobacteria bacterium SG_bin7]